MRFSVATDPRALAAPRSAGQPGTHGLELPPPWCAATPPRATPRRAFQRLRGPHKALRDETRPPSATRADRTRAVPRRRDNSPRRMPVSTRVTGTRPFVLRPAKRCGLKRVVCYPCYAFKVRVGLAE